MTDNAVAVWDPNSGAALPAYLADALGDLGTNIPDRQSVPSLSYEGKTWQIVKEGNRTKLQVANADGDMVPVPIMRVVVLNCNSERGRAYYPGLYNPAASAAPTCWSADGKAPDPSVKEKQSPLCTGCPQSIKGSKVQEGKEMVACSSHRMLAVVPAFELDADPLRLKIAVTSDYDKEIVEHGWYAFRQYMDFLKSRGVGHTALVVTKIKFDVQAQYPKLLFALDRILTAAEIATVKLALANPKVAGLLAEKWTAAGSAGTPVDDSDIAPQPDMQTIEPSVPASQQVIENTPTVLAAALVRALADGWSVHPENPAYYFKGQDVVAAADLEARYVVPEPAAPPPAPVAATAPVVLEHDPRAAALVDGWVQHPDSPPHGYKGQEVLAWEEIEEKYSGNAAASAPAAPATADPAAATAAPTSNSPSDVGAVPADVQGLLDKWTS